MMLLGVATFQSTHGIGAAEVMLTAPDVHVSLDVVQSASRRLFHKVGALVSASIGALAGA